MKKVTEDRRKMSKGPQVKIKFIVEETGEKETIASFKAKHAPKMSYSQLIHRYYMLDRPASLKIEDLNRPLIHGGQNATIIKVGDVFMTMGEIAEKCNRITGIDKGTQFYFSRWVYLKKPKKMESLKWFTMSSEEFAGKRKQERENYGHGCADLSHIKAGDLAHLSSTRNLGRGKGEIPDDEWIEMMARCKRRSATARCTLTSVWMGATGDR